MSSHSFRYLVSPYVAHGHYTLCMLCFFFLLVCSCLLCPLGIWHLRMLHMNTTHIVYDMFLLLLVLSCRLSPLDIWYHYMLHMNTTHSVWYVSRSTGIVMLSLSFRYLVSPSVAQGHYTLCMIFSFITGIVMSSLSIRYLVSPYDVHENYTLCMIGFLYYWYRHVFFLI